MKRISVYIKILINLLLAGAALLGAIFILPRILWFFLPFVIGWIIAAIANPLVKFLETKVKIVRRFSSVMIIVLVIVMIVGGIYAMGYVTVKQISSLSNDLPEIYDRVETSLRTITDQVEERYENLPQSLKKMMDGIFTTSRESIDKTADKIKIPTISGATDLARTAGDFLFMTIMTILSSYFFIVQKENLTQKVRRIFPQSAIEQFDMIRYNFKKAMGGYLIAQIKLMIFVFLVLAVGFLCLRIKYGFFLALLIAFVDFLPVFGMGFIMWPWILVDFITGNYSQVMVLLVLYTICQVVKQVLEPKMLGDSIGLSPFTTLVLVFLGYKLGGFLGMILSLPIGLVVINLYEAGLFDTLISGFLILIHDFNEYRKID